MQNNNDNNQKNLIIISNNYSTNYYLFLINEIFKILFFLMFILFGTLYYINNFLIPAFSIFKLIIVFLMVYVFFAYFFCLLPLKRMLISNLQLFKPPLNLNTNLENFKNLAINKVKEKFNLNFKNEEFNTFITFKLDFYPAFISAFVTLVITYLLYLYLLQFNIKISIFKILGFILLIINYLWIIIGYSYFINNLNSTHFWTTTGFLILSFLFSIYYILTFNINYLLKLAIIIFNFILLVIFLIKLKYTPKYYVFVRPPNLDLYLIKISNNQIENNIKKITYDCYLDFIQSPFAFGIAFFEKYTNYLKDMYYCDIIASELEVIVKVFENHLQNIEIVQKKEWNFKTIDIVILIKKYGKQHFLLLMPIYLTVFLMFYSLFLKH